MAQGLANRILTFPLTRLVLAILFVVAPVTMVQAPLRAGHLERSSWALPAAILASLVAYAAYRVYVATIERREASEFQGPGAGRELGLGMLLGAGLFCATLGIIAAAGAYAMGPRNPVGVVLVPLGGSIVSAVVEEILFRAVLFRIVEASLGSWLALLVSAVVFGLAHLANPGSGLIPATSIVVEAGILLAAAYMLTRRLWLPIGLHFAWNLTEAGIFGADISGRSLPGLFIARFAGPAWLTGGSFGPEASVVAVAICLTAGIAMLIVAARRGRWVAPFWARPREAAASASPAAEIA